MNETKQEIHGSACTEQEGHFWLPSIIASVVRLKNLLFTATVVRFSHGRRPKTTASDAREAWQFVTTFGQSCGVNKSNGMPAGIFKCAKAMTTRPGYRLPLVIRSSAGKLVGSIEGLFDERLRRCMSIPRLDLPFKFGGSSESSEKKQCRPKHYVPRSRNARRRSSIRPKHWLDSGISRSVLTFSLVPDSCSAPHQLD